MFTIKSLKIDKTNPNYITVLGEEDAIFKQAFGPIQHGDILTEDKYNGHQIFVSSIITTKDNEYGLLLDNKSMHPKCIKPFEKISTTVEKGMSLMPGIHLMRITRPVIK